MRPSPIPAKRAASPTHTKDKASPSPPSKTRKRVPAEIWEVKRPIITRLYQEEKRSLKEVMDIMERDYKFTATVKMYKSRIWKWGLDKKLKGDEVLAILLLKRDRDAMDKPSEFRIRGQIVDLDNINRYLKRNPALMARYRAGQVPSIQTTLEVDCRTPSPSPMTALAPNLEMQNTEALLALFRDYVDGSFAAGAWNWEYDIDCVSSRPTRDRSNELFERVIASFALVNRCMMRGDKISISCMLDPSFESLKEIVEAESPVFVARTVCLLWYLERHHKHDLLRLVLNYLAGLVPIVLGQHHIMTQIWRRLGTSEFSDYYELSLRLYEVLLPEMESRIGSANYLTHVLYDDYIDCIYARQGPEASESIMRTHRMKAEASGRNHAWLSELAISHVGLIAASRENEGRLDEAVRVLADFTETRPLSQDHAASVNLQMGVYYFRMGNLHAGITCSKKAARLALTSETDDRVSITSLANLEMMMREAGRGAEADRVLHYRMQLLAGFAERSVSISTGSLEADEDDDLDFEPAILSYDELPPWLQRTDDEAEEAKYAALFAENSFGKFSTCSDPPMEWADLAAAALSPDYSHYSTGVSPQHSRRNSDGPSVLSGYSLQGSDTTHQGYSPYVPPELLPLPEPAKKASVATFFGPTLSPPYEGGPSPYYPPPPERGGSPYYADRLDRTSPYYAPGLSPQPEGRSPYYVPSPHR